MKFWKQLCACGVAMAILVGGCLVVQNNGQTLNQTADNTATSEYSSKIFDSSYVHTINIDISEEDWEELLANPTDETFYSCNLTIDGETYNNVGIRTKGNSSLSQVADSDSDRYSFKVNFGKYDKEQSYYGLDKFVLNNLVQDATMMKDYLSYTLMSEFGVASPEVSYSYITINGEEWGLYLNAECLDESFLERNYGEDHGNLYKPSTDDMMGGGMKGGRPGADGNGDMPQMPFDPADQGGATTNADASDSNATQETGIEIAEEQKKMGMGAPAAFGMDKDNGASLKYVDDSYDSYSAIFDNAETKITDADKDTLIASLKQISEGTNLDEVLDTDALLRYFVVHNFVDNYDSYTGTMLHNYYLYEEDGKLTMLPWDYNLAFGAFSGGGRGGNPPGMQGQVTGDNANATSEAVASTENGNTGNGAAPIENGNAGNGAAPAENGNTGNGMGAPMGEGAPENNGMMGSKQEDGSNASSMVNMAIDTPLLGAEEEDRPMWSQLINNEAYKEQYHTLFDEFLTQFIESGKLEAEINRVVEMISPYVEKDPTAFYTYDEFQTAIETLKTFISLRGQSIRAQLTGEIPSTTDEQNSFTGELIDASSITLSDMGSHAMGHGDEGDMQRKGMNRGVNGGRDVATKNAQTEVQSNQEADRQKPSAPQNTTN